MATITATTNEKIFPIKRWLGLNQSRDGDTKLKMGEAAVMENWRVTRDGNLRRRPGTELLETLGNSEVMGLWSGRVAATECVLVACAGKLYRLFDGADWNKAELGSISTSRDVFIFGFDECAYILDGDTYRVYDGETLKPVEGYRPLIQTATKPDGSGTTLEQVNKLNGMRRAQYSPDGAATSFVLPEKKISSVDYAKNLVTGETFTGYTVDLTAGAVTFETAPEQGVNTVEIGWTTEANYRYQVDRMRYAELYNGTQDSRVFLYGDGSNEVFYSGLDTNGMGRADYFPDMNEAQIGESNTPVTALIRHGGRLMAFKTDGTYSIAYTSMALADGSVIAAFNITTVNKTIGNAAYGQARLVLNYPRTVFGKDIYEWKGSSTYVTADERLAKRVSDRVQTAMRSFVAEDCRCWDDNSAQEYYVCYGRTAIVHNYAVDAWYTYTNFDARCMCNFRNELYMGTSDGRVLRLTDRVYTDCGVVIPAYWESGSMDFNADYMRKYTSMFWVSVKPESRSHVEITIKTDRKSEFPVKTIAKTISSFGEMNFASFSFITSNRPYITRLRIKAKKYAYYKLIFQNSEANTTATVLAVDIRVRETGYAK